MVNTALARRSSPVSLRVIFGVLLGLLVLSFTLGTGAPAAHAATSDVCVADAETACFNGTIKGVGAGVKLTIDGNGENVVVETDKDGKWNAAVKAAGTYTITLDEKTLPAGVTLKGDPVQEREITLGFVKGAIFAVNGATGEGADNGQSQEQIAAEGFNWDRLAQQVVSGLRLGLLLALASIGLSLIYGTTGLSSFSHAEQVTLGGLLGYTFANVLGLNIFVTIIIVVILTGATGYIQDAVIWKPLRKKGLSLTQMIIVTIGLALALQYTFQMFYGASTVRILMKNPETFTIGPVTLTFESLWAMGLSVIVLILVGLFLLKTRTGRATRAVSDNPALAAASGIDVDRIIRLVWVIATALAGLSGVMLGLVLNGINWQTGMQLLLLMFAAVTLGGLGTAFGALVGSLIIGMTVELANFVVPGDFKYATALVLLIIILLVRPQGIFGRKERIG
ncbi:branched-chain amino acid ABC transporter permease [Aurantimicrobium minutum]|uniref:branched-chain amino acid ABC transporter permease n=1 Tax=Aurantimicrobium minutum TaxID=708131 RepID=UPI002475F0AC|nr:branched-chain amino acid ABC transporter permease [Aurantimicrobium minutum]MDH6410414.1 neutral amino acid transport system permease protein [Aurantimicrobium minutum]MDH6536793.1 neutral amino acid transport system permease protein [Aurantimicrobium minutum]